MKHVATLIAGLAAMLLLASCFIGGEKSERQMIVEELKEEGWVIMELQPTGEDDDTWDFTVDTDVAGQQIMVSGTLVHEEDGIEPVEMTAYGFHEGYMNIFRIGTWDPINDWTYTAEGEEYLFQVNHYVD